MLELTLGRRGVEDRRKKRSNLNKFLADVESSQRNTVWPGPFVNSRSVDKFFWRGFPKPTLVQRVAAWLFGLTFIGLSWGFLNLAVLEDRGSSGRVAFGAISIGILALGGRVFRNGFPRHNSDTEDGSQNE